jgi:hypothetical protein
VAKIIRPKIQVEITVPTTSTDSKEMLDIMLNVEALILSWMKFYLKNTPQDPTLTIGIVYPGKKK